MSTKYQATGRAHDRSCGRRQRASQTRSRAVVSLLFAIAMSACSLLAEEPKDQFVGRLEEGRTYRKVNGEPITGREVADYVVEQDWEKELAAFAERELVSQEMARLQVAVSDSELDEELKRMTLAFAQRNNVNPGLLTPEELGRRLGTTISTLRDQQRTQLGLKKILVQEGKLKQDANPEETNVRAILSQRLESVIKEKGVVTDPEKLSPEVGLQIGDRPYPRAAVRAFILERLGPLLRNELTDALETITLKRLVREALAARGVDALSEDDRVMHLSYQVALLEIEPGIANGRELLAKQLKEQGLSMKQFMRHPAFLIDASLTCLARRAVGEEQIRAEFNAHPEKYRLAEKKLAHLFLRVRDLQGRGYAPKWETPEHPNLQAFVATVRDERFAATRREIEKLVPLAKTDFAATVREHSEDEGSRRRDEPGLIGRFSERSVLPEPLDASLLKTALNLKPGEVSEPLRSAYGWHLIKCLDDQTTKYEEARHLVYLRLLKMKREALLKEIREGANVKDSF